MDGEFGGGVIRGVCCGAGIGAGMGVGCVEGVVWPPSQLVGRLKLKLAPPCPSVERNAAKPMTSQTRNENGLNRISTIRSHARSTGRTMRISSDMVFVFRKVFASEVIDASGLFGALIAVDFLAVEPGFGVGDFGGAADFGVEVNGAGTADDAVGVAGVL